MAPFKETEPSQLCVSEIPSCRTVRRLTSFEKAMNMKNMLSLLVELLPTCSSSVIENLSKCTVSWDRTKILGIRQSGPFFPKWKNIAHIDTRSLQVVRKHKSRRNWFAHALTKKDKVQKKRVDIIFHNTPNHESSRQVTLTGKSDIMVHPSTMFAKETFQRTTIIPYALKSFSENMKPPIKIMIQFTRTSSCGEPFMPPLDYTNADSSKNAQEPKIIETRSESSIASNRFKSLETSSSSESIISNESYKSSISSVVMVTLPKALSETLKCASAFSNSGKLSLEKFVSKSATSQLNTSNEIRHSSFSENSMKPSISYDSLTHSGSSISTSSVEKRSKEFSKLKRTYLRKLPRCRKKLKVDVCPAKKYSCKKRSKMRWLKTRKLVSSSKEHFNEKQFTDIKYRQENKPKILRRKRARSVGAAISTSLLTPAKIPHITRSVRVMADGNETDHECTITQDVSLPDIEPLDLGKPLKTIESGRSLSSSDPVTSPDTWSACLTPVPSQLTNPKCITRSTLRRSKFPSVTRRKTKRRTQKEKRKKVCNSDFGPKTQRSRRRYTRSHRKNRILPKELFFLPANDSLFHYVHSGNHEKRGLSPVRSVCLTKKDVPQINDPPPVSVSKGGISSCKRQLSPTVNTQQRPISGRKRSLSGTPRSLSANRRSTSLTKTYLSASEKPRIKIKRSRLQATPTTKLSHYLSDQFDTEVIAPPTTACPVSSSTFQPRAVGRMYPDGIVGSSLKLEQIDSKGEKHLLTATKLQLTPLTSSPSYIATLTSCTTKPSSPASWFTPTKYSVDRTVPSNVKPTSACSTREGHQTPTSTKRPLSGSTRSSSPATTILTNGIRRANRNSPTRLGVISPTENTRKPPAELKHQFSCTSNPKRGLKRKSQVSVKSNTTMKRKKSPKRNTFTPTKSTRAPSKTTTSTGGEKSSQPNHTTRNSFHTVDSPAKNVQVSSRVVQKSRPLRKSGKTLRSSSPNARMQTLAGCSTSSTGRPQTPNGRPPSPVGRPSSPIGRLTQISRTMFPIWETASRNWRTASPNGRRQSRIERTISSIGRTQSPIGRTHSPIGTNFSVIARTPSRATCLSNKSTRKPHGNSQGTAPAECTSFQVPSTPNRKRRAQSRRAQEPAQKIRPPLQSTWKQNILPGLSCPSSFLTRTPPLSALPSSASNSPFQLSSTFLRRINSSVHSASSTSRSSKTTTQSVNGFSRTANKASRLPCTPTDHVARLNRSVLTPPVSSCPPVKSSRSRSENVHSLKRNVRVTSRVTRTPTRITRKVNISNRKPRKTSRKATRNSAVSSTIFFSPRVYFKSPSRSIRIPAKFPRSPSKDRRTPRRTRKSSSSRRNTPSSQISRAQTPNTPVTCSTATTQTTPMQTPSPPTTTTPQAVEVCDRGTSSCPVESLHHRMANTSKASSSWMRLGNAYLCVTNHKDSSHRTSEMNKKDGRKKNRSVPENIAMNTSSGNY